MNIVMSSGHGKYIRGASGILDEVNEARRVVEAVAGMMRDVGHSVITFHDDVSTTQNENLNRIVDFHNSQVRDLDVSVHFNANVETSAPVGTECLYISQKDLARRVATTISESGNLIDRGPKERTDLFFLNNTAMPAILIETCFVDSEADAAAYEANFDAICEAIATVGIVVTDDVVVEFEGSCSWFGGPEDEGVDADEGLAFLYEYDDAPNLFLDKQPEGTTGLARRLDPSMPYVACRWDYNVTPKTMLADRSFVALVSAGHRRALAWPADWGPHEDTNRVADLSPGIFNALGLTTDDTVKVVYPWRGRRK